MSITQTQAPYAAPGDGRPRTRNATLGPALALAGWRMRRAWRLLLAVELGMVVAVTLACAVPIFTQATLTAGLRAALMAYPGANAIVTNVSTNTPSRQMLSEMDTDVSANARQNLTPYHIALRPTPYTAIFAQNLALASPEGVAKNSSLSLEALTADEMANIHLVAGRLPQAANGALEIAVTQATAKQWSAHVGTTRIIATNQGSPAQPLILRVVGIVTTFTTPLNLNADPNTFPGPAGQVTQYTALTLSDAVLDTSYPWNQLALNPVFKALPQDIGLWGVTQQYYLDFSHMTTSDADALLHGPDARGVSQFGSAAQGFQVLPNQITIDGSALVSAVRAYLVRAIGAQIGGGVLLAAILGLALLFLGLMSGALVERQEDAITLARSRGASRRQVYLAFSAQGALLGLVALIAGPFLATGAAWLLMGRLEPSVGSQPLTTLLAHPQDFIATIWPEALALALVMTGALLWSLRGVAGRNALTLRRETTRATQQPLWKRLYLDVLVAILALAGYGLLWLADRLSGAAPTYSNAAISSSLTPLALLAPLFLMLAVALLFMRFFPLALRLAERLASRGRGASVTLAFASLTRASRSTLRLALLLALGLGFALMVANAQTALNRYAVNAAEYATGADVSGPLARAPENGSAQSVAQLTATYRNLPGVTAASLGHIDAGSLNQPGAAPTDWSLPQGVFIVAADMSTYPQTAIWPGAEGATLQALARRLRQPAADGATPAIIDGSASERLRLTTGSEFQVWASGGGQTPVRFVVAGVVKYIPQIYANQSTVGGSALVDYQVYASALAHAAGTPSSANLIAPNMVWLRTRGDSASLSALHAALQAGPLQLVSTTFGYQNFPESFSVIDRRALAETLRQDPLYLTLDGALLLGAITALSLALLGLGIIVWLSVRERRTAYAFLRALGAGPRRIVRSLALELGVVFGAAIALGMALGAGLTATMVKQLPILALTVGSGPIPQGGPPPVVTLASAPTIAMLAGTLAVCGVVALLAARSAIRPQLGERLRLNED